MNRKLVAWVGVGTLTIVIACASGGDTGTGDQFIDNCHDARGIITHETTATSAIERCMVHGKQIGVRVTPRDVLGNDRQ